MMNFFESIRQKHLGDKPLQYLWQLRVTDAEYVELKQLLAKIARSYSPNVNNRFITVCKECTLMIAEFWRREYEDGSHSKEMVFKAIDPNIKDVNAIEEFYQAAKKGARALHIEIYKAKNEHYFDSMLYQGGLPMKLVTGSATNSVWDSFTRGLVNKRVNFDELNLSIVASNNQCLKAYCDQLIKGIEFERHKLMPFYCQNENDAWFLYLKELAKQERIRHRQQHPMKLYIEFKVDNVEKTITTKYVFKSDQRLTQAFLEDNGLLNVNFFSVQVRKNGQAVDTFDYINNFCRYNVVSKHPYIDGDNISVFLHNQEEPYLTDDLDMEVPHILYQDKDGKYISGNRMGRDNSLLLIPEGWDVENDHLYIIHNYTWGEKKLRGILIDAGYTEDIIVTSPDGAITFGMSAALYWTDIQSHPLYLPDIIEPVYNADKCSFALCYDTENGVETKRRNVQFRSKWEKEWSDVPSYGEIFARAIDLNGNYVTPESFINIGDGLAISLLNADKDTCQIKIAWPHGHISTKEGERKVNDVWEIKKENCQDPRKIQFLFTPEGNSKNQFVLSVKAPFKDFSIVNIYGDNIENDSWVPYSDVDKYQYHLVGQDVKEYTYGNVRRQLRWKGEKLHIIEEGRSLKTIPSEGSLVTLFDSRESLRSLLERTSQNMLNAEVKVQFTLSDGKSISFSIKESPFRPRQIDDGRIVITGNNRKPVKFTGMLKLLKLSEPALKAEEMEYNGETGYYHLPESIRSWGKTLLIGRTRGRICPALVDLTKEMDGEYRANNRETTIATISENLIQSTMGDELWERIIGWFDRSQKEDIPASSVLELYCTAQNYKSLLCLAFQLYARCGSEEELTILKDMLKSYSSDLSFQWYWLNPYLTDIMIQLSPFIPDPSIKPIQNIYIKWAMQHEGEERLIYLSALNNPDKYIPLVVGCLGEVMSSFTNWMKDLCVSSLVEQYGSTPEPFITSLAGTIINNRKNCYRVDFDADRYVENNQEYLGEETATFFNSYMEPGTLGNEQWLYKRVNAVVAHINKQINLFTLKNDIRRSIIFCTKSSNYHFIIALNNKLSQ